MVLSVFDSVRVVCIFLFHDKHLIPAFRVFYHDKHLISAHSPQVNTKLKMLTITPFTFCHRIWDSCIGPEGRVP